MSTYTKTTNFTAKDNLTSGDPAKVIKGSEFDTEFNALETAVNSKSDKNNGTHTGTTTIATADIDNLQIDSVAVTATAAEINTLDGITASTAELNITDGLTATTAELNTLDGITSTTAELNLLDGVTATTAELNILDGVTSTTAEINKLDGFTGTADDLNYAKDLRATGVTTTELDVLDGMTATTAELNILDGATVTTSELNILDGVTATASEINITDGLTATTAELNTLDGITATTDELNILDGVTATASEINTLDGITATTTELNYTDGVTSNIQTQLDAKANLSGANFTGDVDVTGTVTADGLTVDGDGSIGTGGSASSNRVLTINSTSNTAYGGLLRGQKNGSNVYLTGELSGMLGSGTGYATWVYGSNPFNVYTNSNKRFNIAGNGDVSFYEDTGTTAKMVWDASAESLGIGTSSPVEKLYVNSTSGDARIGLNAPTGSDTEIKFSNNGTVEYSIGHDDATDNFVIGTTNVDSDLVSVTKAGRVGIGTNSPNTNVLLHVQGEIGTTNGTASDPTHTFYGDPNTGMFRAAVDTLGFTTNGSERFRIGSTGSVGIGTTNPIEKLHVEGKIFSTTQLRTGSQGSSDACMQVSKDGAESIIRFGSLETGNYGYDTRVRFQGRNDSGTPYYGDIRFDPDARKLHLTPWHSDQSHLVLEANNGTKVGIGTSSPSDTLEIADANSQLRLTDTDDSKFCQFSYSSGKLAIRNNATSVDHLWLDDSGRVGIGTSSPSVDLHVRDSSETYIRAEESTNGNFIQLYQQASDSYLMAGKASGTPTQNLRIYTGGSEKARIDSAGSLLVGTTTVSVYNGTTSGVAMTNSGYIFAGKSGDAPMYLNRISNNGDIVKFSREDTVVGSISVTGSATSYNTSSDERLKENIQDTTHTVDINDIRVREFDWKVDGEHQRFGFIAQELETVFPEAVNTDDSEEAMKSVDYSKLVPLLVKEIQELKARIETLENN
jgi:hypothetical protein